MKSEGKKWTTLTHKGPTFPAPYKAQNFSLGSECLNSTAEEMLWLFSAYTGTDWFKNKLFVKNFYNDLKPYLTVSQKALTFIEDPEYTALFLKMSTLRTKIKETRKAETKESKELRAKETQALKDKYGVACVDGKSIPISTYMVEGPRIFVGRGTHKLSGIFIPQIQPEDITINCSGEAPKAPEGHSWGKVEENPNTAMTFYYTLDRIKARKFAIFAQTSDYGKMRNKMKFDKVENLVLNWKKVNDFINKNLDNKDKKVQEIAAIAYLIKNFGIRAGNEDRLNNEDFADDVVGASTLKKENLTPLENLQISLDYKGKDSVPFKAVVGVNQSFYDFIKQRYSETKDGEFLFPNANSQDVNTFLDSILPGLTCKNFRTAYGSALLAKAFRDLDVSLTDGGIENNTTAIKIKMDEAQLVVAKKLNHQRNVGKKQQESLSKAIDGFKEKEDKTKEKLEKIKQEIKETEDKDKKNKLKEKFDKVKKNLELLGMKKTLKKETADSSISTSKSNYSDPRVIISFCKSKDIPIEKIYSKTLIKKFDWALDTDKSFYKGYPEAKEDN